MCRFPFPFPFPLRGRGGRNEGERGSGVGERRLFEEGLGEEREEARGEWRETRDERGSRKYPQHASGVGSWRSDNDLVPVPRLPLVPVPVPVPVPPPPHPHPLYPPLSLSIPPPPLSLTTMYRAVPRSWTALCARCWRTRLHQRPFATAVESPISRLAAYTPALHTAPNAGREDKTLRDIL